MLQRSYPACEYQRADSQWGCIGQLAFKQLLSLGKRSKRASVHVHHGQSVYRAPKLDPHFYKLRYFFSIGEADNSASR